MDHKCSGVLCTHCAADRIRAAARQQIGLPPVEPREPRPRAVPEVGSPELEPPTPLLAPVTVVSDETDPGKYWLSTEEPERRLVVAVEADSGDWSRGFDYESLGEGHYEDDQL